MPHLTIDNMQVEVPKGCTILDAARKLGIDIPTLCYYQPLGPSATCMVCLVKVGGQNGFLPACSTRAADGMVVQSRTDDVLEARRKALELLLGDHLGDCMAPCQCLCPAGMNIPLMIRQIAAGRLVDALETVRRRIALPGVLGRICPAPCERGCRRAQRDAAVAVCLLKRFAADASLLEKSQRVSWRMISTGKRVAVIGAGPAGLSAAFYLRRRGHAVAVFDEGDRPGGQLPNALAEHGMPRDVLDAEVEMIRNLGTAFHQGVRVGRDVTLEMIRKDYNAVLLATGSPKADGSQLGVATADGRIAASRETYATDQQGVFAAGAAVRKISRMAVRACADAREAAESIDQFLAGKAPTGPARPISVHIGRLREGEIEKLMACASAAARVEPAGGASAGFSADEAVAEANRCLHCDCRKPVACKLRRCAQQCQAHAARHGAKRRSFEHDLTHGKVVYESGKCILCGTCIRLCQQAGEALGLAYIGRGFNVRVGVPFGEGLSAGLTKLADECVAACPTGALAFKDDSLNRYEA